MINKTITSSISFLLALLILGVFAWPKYQELKSIQEKIGAKETELQYLEEYFKNLKTLSEELKKHSDNLSKIDSFLPSDPSLPSLLEFLQKTGSEHGLILKKIGQATSSSSKTQERIKEYQIQLSLSGSYSSLKSYLAALEKTSRLIEVDSISFFSPREGEELFTFDLMIKFHSY